jgi:hypothetical protein
MQRCLTHKVVSLMFVFLAFGSAPTRAISLPGAVPAPVAFTSKRSVSVSALRQRGQKQGGVWQRTELYFGTQRLGRSDVTDREFALFVDEEVTPRFPAGLTLHAVYGQFRNMQRDIVQEHSKVLVLFYPETMKEANKNIEEIRTAYKKAFQQESVMRVDSTVRISF